MPLKERETSWPKVGLSFADESRKVGQLRPQDMQISVLGYAMPLAGSRVGRDEPPTTPKPTCPGDFYFEASW